MKILIVCSKNSGQVAPFITEQVDGLIKAGVTCDYYTIEGKGITGYLKNLIQLKKKINSFQPQLIHAHYGLSGLLANLQRKVPVVTTYHGSDINHPKAFRFSKWSIKLSAWNIFVSQKNVDKSGVVSRYSLLPCGVDLAFFQPVEKLIARNELGLDENEKLILFAGAFDNQVKNPELAIKAVERLSEVRLIELKAYTRQQVVWLMNAVDVCLMTSFTEGSPQFIKEAMACNCPVVSVAVGDVPNVLADVEGCYLSPDNSSDLAFKITEALHFGKRTNGREKIRKLMLDSQQVVDALFIIYRKL